jgi:5'-nucleotidase/UDP-sugar diphosphatase
VSKPEKIRDFLMKNKGYIFWLFFLLFTGGISAAVFSSTGQPSHSNRMPEEEIRIVIYHVNYIHGELENFSKIAWLINRERKKNPNVFFFCAGDNFSGNPYVDRSSPRGKPILDLMNHLGCDIQVLGNHDFDYGQDVLKGYVSRAGFEIICANIKTGSGKITQPRPFVILKTGQGIKIAVLGIIQISRDTGIPDTNPDNVLGLKFDDGIETALKYRDLKNRSNVFVALTHLGYRQDEKLAMRMPELDVIIGGHSHTIIEKSSPINGVLIAQAGSRNKYLGRIELRLRHGQIVYKQACLIDLGKIKDEDLKTREMIQAFTRIPELDQVIATFAESLVGDHAMGNLVTDAICDILKLDVAFYNTGGIRIHSLGKTVRLRDVYAVDPFDNEVVVFKLTPTEIRSLIRYDHEHIGPLDLRVSGILYTVRVDRKRRVISVDISLEDGTQLDENKTYLVGMNNYMASVYRFEHRDPGHSAYVKVVDVLISFLKKEVNLQPIRNSVRSREEFIR